MNIHTPSDSVKAQASLDPEVRTASANGAGVDCRGFERALVVLHVGAHDRTTGDETLDVKIQESSDNGAGDAFGDVGGGEFAQIGNVVPNATKGNVYVMDVDLSKRERYLRVVGTAAGTTPSTAYGVTILLFNPRYAPVTQDATPVGV